MPKKPVKWGIKLWCLCDANTGYCLVFSVYTGSSESAGANLDLGYRVVMSLMRRHLHSYHHLYADNFFTSVHLAVDRKQADTYLCGTTRSSRRECPKPLAAVHLQTGQSVKLVNDDSVMLCKWHGKRDVFIIATNDAGGDSTRQVRRNRQQIDLTVPTCVKIYNKHMGGVDHLDQMRSYYGVGRAGRKWWKYLFWGSSTRRPTSCGWLPTVHFLPTRASSHSSHSNSSLFTTCATDTMRGYSGSLPQLTTC